MGLRVLRALFLLGSLAALYVAYDEYESGNAAKSELMAELPLFSQAMSEIEELSKLDVKPLRETEAAMEELVARLVDDTELLGSSVRLEIPKEGLSWSPVNFGVTKTKLAVTTQATAYGGIGYFYILWQLIMRQPIQVTGAEIGRKQAVVVFRVEMELYAVDSNTVQQDMSQGGGF